MFGNSMDTARARIILDSKSRAPGWGLMGEGATGKINGSFTKEEKNQVRLLRVIVSESKWKNCLRYDVHNFLSLHRQITGFILMLNPSCSSSRFSP
mmetsp:Transcript_25718/g.53590  ORF Transcript_25718/g.53590 Transcript_25718/m.53590 type:complete len:96 (-) Transcript_25718:2800-3087(-)